MRIAVLETEYYKLRVSFLFSHRNAVFLVGAAETKGQAGSWDIYCSIRSGSRQQSAAKNPARLEMERSISIMEFDYNR
jgi:hypothetical protein